MAKRFVLRRSLLVPVRDRKAFLDIYFQSGNHGGLLLPTSSPLRVGDACEMEIAFAAENMIFHARGVARWRRTRAQRNLPAGVGVELDEDDRATHDVIVAFARGEELDLGQRKARRYPVELPVEINAGRGTVATRTHNLSIDGCNVLVDDPPKVGTRVRLRLDVPGFLLGIGVDGEVVWCTTRPSPRIGLRFVDVKPATRKKLEALIQAIRDQIAVEGEGS